MYTHREYYTRIPTVKVYIPPGGRTTSRGQQHTLMAFWAWETGASGIHAPRRLSNMDAYEFIDIRYWKCTSPFMSRAAFYEWKSTRGKVSYFFPITLNSLSLTRLVCCTLCNCTPRQNKNHGNIRAHCWLTVFHARALYHSDKRLEEEVFTWIYSSCNSGNHEENPSAHSDFFASRPKKSASPGVSSNRGETCLVDKTLS